MPTNSPAPSTLVAQVEEALRDYFIPGVASLATADEVLWRVRPVLEAYERAQEQKRENVLQTAKLIEREQDAEIARLREALEKLTDDVAQMIEDSRGVFTLAQVHGCPYAGRTVDVHAARAALGKE